MTVWFEDYLASWGTGDVDQVLAWLTDDVAFEDVGAGHRARGTAAMRKFVASSFELVPDSTFDLVGGSELDGAYVYEWVMQPMGVRGVSVGRRVDGKIAENRDYWSSKTFKIPQA